MDDILLEPLKAYQTHFRAKFAENAEAHLQKLISVSGVDVEQNRHTVSLLRTEETFRDKAQKRVSLLKGLRIFLIVVIVLAAITATISAVIYTRGKPESLPLILIAASAGVVLISLLSIFLLLNPKIKHNEEIRRKHAEKAEKFLSEARSQMIPLNALFTSGDTKNLIEATIPLLKIDDNFNMRRYDVLSTKYGLPDNDDKNRSTIAVVSGEILGNPFVIDRELVKEMTMHTYTGSITITWTTRHTDSQGNTYTQTHTQTLTASVDKPKPEYSEATRLIYGNEAAPDLTFTHTPSHSERLSDGAFESAVKSGMKKIQKLQKEAMKSGQSNFTEMGNADFDVMFGALDRDHEVQFRLLFTPLAQKNMLELMRSKDGFGDDFVFRKQQKLNLVSSEHSAFWDLDTSYKRYAGYDVDAISKGFLDFNNAYFKNMFFDFAPILSIPLYQQHKPKEYIYKDTYARNYSNFEAECAVNALGQSVFAHPVSATDAILKTRFIKKDGTLDELGVDAYSFRTEARVDHVPKLGGDGMIHSVPVHWTEYIPVEFSSVVTLKALGISDREYDATLLKSESADGEGIKAKNAKESAESVTSKGKSVFLHGLLCSLVSTGGKRTDKHIDDVFGI